MASAVATMRWCNRARWPLPSGSSVRSVPYSVMTKVRGHRNRCLGSDIASAGRLVLPWVEPMLLELGSRSKNLECSGWAQLSWSCSTMPNPFSRKRSKAFLAAPAASHHIRELRPRHRR